MRHRTLLALITICLCAPLVRPDTCPAAVMTAIQDLTPTPTEVLNNGDVVAAVNLGENQDPGVGLAQPITINGVNFVTLATPLPGVGSVSTTLNETFVGPFGQVQLSTIARGFATFRGSDIDGNGSSDVPAPLDALYDPIIAGNNGGNPNDVIFNFSNLVMDSRYRFQLFMASGNQTVREVDVLQNGSTLLATFDNSTTPHTEIITLEWFADQPTEQVILRGNPGAGNLVPVVSGFNLIVNAVPEPSTGLLFGLAGMALVRNRRKRKS